MNRSISPGPRDRLGISDTHHVQPVPRDALAHQFPAHRNGPVVRQAQVAVPGSLVIGVADKLELDIGVRPQPTSLFCQYAPGGRAELR